MCFGGGSNQGPLEYKSESLTLKLTSLGEPGGGSFTGTFERNKSISGFLSWTQRTLRF
jgi:hypothetical protein